MILHYRYKPLNMRLHFPMFSRLLPAILNIGVYATCTLMISWNSIIDGRESEYSPNKVSWKTHTVIVTFLSESSRMCGCSVMSDDNVADDVTLSPSIHQTQRDERFSQSSIWVVDFSWVIETLSNDLGISVLYTMFVCKLNCFYLFCSIRPTTRIVYRAICEVVSPQAPKP